MHHDSQLAYTEAEIVALNDVADAMSDAALRLPVDSPVRADLRMWALRVAAALPLPDSLAEPAESRPQLRLVK